MSSSGSFARYMLVVFHHNGSPSSITVYSCQQSLDNDDYPECENDMSSSDNLGWGRWRRRHCLCKRLQWEYLRRLIEFRVVKVRIHALRVADLTNGKNEHLRNLNCTNTIIEIKGNRNTI